ncbi:hypothetical protein GDO81_010645 [Engystomops pustulosus]|uniref:Uncharacterized protein n=1 Tax=Engystomops pustulosus TaxID=76066 RepID=A0AAV7C2J3_ENGPU|nr:hypothetical protein GDO81_010645 [Engystomops pustulosus]
MQKSREKWFLKGLTCVWSTYCKLHVWHDVNDTVSIAIYTFLYLPPFAFHSPWGYMYRGKSLVSVNYNSRMKGAAALNVWL